MLSDRAIAFLQPLTFSKTALRKTCLIPLGGIYWDDEIPDFHKLMAMPEKDRSGIYRLLSIRFKIWDGVAPEGDDRKFWDAARAKVPEYALFSRLELSNEDRALQEEIEREVEEGFKCLLADADEVKVTEQDGFKSFSATFDLTKEDDSRIPKKPWWKRLLGL
jgi:hypothetical protein